MRFEIEVNDEGVACAQTTTDLARRIADDLSELLRRPTVLHASPGSGMYTIHRVLPPVPDVEFDKLTEGH